ncbi:hypothetical protein ETB97_004112 [Aspergillus alliaceus]|uniref:tRNA-intron lyase n=1 Tax=Petromyces alliaceus TaxID=209559 RepID=A0A8H6AEG8_PETAA|nr:hypothetical protein ETB97_004112 [Aspergillus burnettii]
MASQSNSVPNPPCEAAAVAAKSESTKKNAPQGRPGRSPRTNYRHIHRFPLPLSVHPLPPLIPHNPLSIVSVLLSYLTYLIAPPHHEVYSAYFDSDTSSVHVTDAKAIRALWEMGFFGKGSLSRSEPSWLDREKKRRGLLGGLTSEEVTRQRRTERRELKLERARMEKLAIEQRLKAEATAREVGDTSIDQSSLLPPADGATNGMLPAAEKFSLRKAKEAKLFESQHSVAQTEEGSMPDALDKSSLNGGKAVRFSPVVQAKEFVSDSTVIWVPDSVVDGHGTGDEPSLDNEEHLQLSNEEAFFLAYGLGALQIFDGERNDALSSSSLLSLFCQHSHFPRGASSDLEPADPFLISYVVYHHFRSLGWVVRSGVKFGVDYLLYNRGPVFSHAEFAVVVIPSFEHHYWSETEERKAHYASKQARSWWWLHCVNRVQAQVKKSMVVCYVEVPPPLFGDPGDIGALLTRYQDDSIDIAKLQRVALGLEAAQSQSLLPGSELVWNTSQDSGIEENHSQNSDAPQSTIGQKVPRKSPSIRPESPSRSLSRKQAAKSLTTAVQPSPEQERQDIAAVFYYSKKMSSAETAPSDTQVISQSVYDDLIRQNQEAADNGMDNNLADNATLRTLHEGDLGHVDLLAEFDGPNTDATNLDENEDQSSFKLGESSPLQYQPNIFPESQRFVSKTPATAVKTGQVDGFSSVTPTASRNPLVTDLESSGGIMALSQVFKATQAPSSPLVHGQQSDPISERPSPNLPIQNHPLATALSSPLNNIAATFPQDSSELQNAYITMKESQVQRDRILRERMTRSAEHIYSEDQSDGEFDKEPSFVERIRRQKIIDEETTAQLANLSAPSRPASRKNPDKMSKSPCGQPDQRNWSDAVKPATSGTGHQGTTSAGATSEEETEQEDDSCQQISRFQEPNSTTEEDKENCINPSATPIAVAASVHDRLSQALALENGTPSCSRRGSLQDTEQLHLRSHGAGDNQPDETGRSSQVYIVKDSQRSPVCQDDENRMGKNREMWDENQAQASSSLFHTKPSPAKLRSPAKQLRIRSTPPSVSQRSRVSFQLDDDRIVTRSRSNSASSHGSHEYPPRNSTALGTNAIQSSNSTVQKSIDLGDKAPAFDLKEKLSSMPSRVAETPVQRPRSFADVVTTTTIPETSPNRFFNQGWASDTNNEVMDQEDDDLPPPYPSIHERVYHSQPANSDSSSPVKNLYNSKILSSPSGRQRRALTEIAADASPQLGAGPFDVDISILSADDREFRSAVALSPAPPRKRRRVNDGQSVSASDPVFPVPPRTTTYFAFPKENETMHMQDPQPEESLTRADATLDKRSRPSRRVDTVWDVDDSPQHYVSRKERTRLFNLPRILEMTAEDVDQLEKGADAQPVTAHNSLESTPPLVEQHFEDSRAEPSVDAVEAKTVRVDPGNVEIAVNQVLAAWSGTKRAFYPATCFGTPFGTSQSRYVVKFEDSAPVEVPIGAVKRLELRVGDAVKVDMPHVPKVTHIIRGFEDKLSMEDLEKEASNGIIPMTDVYGHLTVILGQKQRKNLTREGLTVPENIVKVPISRIYLDTIRWNQLKDRVFSYSSIPEQPGSRLQTPSDRHITPASPSTRLSRSIRYANGIFAGMVFAVSYGENDEAKHRITQMIVENDGRILHDGFNELFDLPSSRPVVTPSKSPIPTTSNNQFRLTSGADDVRFACLIANKHSRRPKYMQALALNLPCLSDRWVEDCVAQRQIIDWDMYLLPAGESSYLNGATKSRILNPYPAMQARLPETIAARPNLLHGQSVLVVMGRGKADEERRRAPLFLTYALGASRVEHVPDIKSARAVLDQGGTGAACEWDWIYVDNDEKASAIATILGASVPGNQKAYLFQRSRKRKRTESTESINGSDLGLSTNVRIVGNEFVCQSLILGRLID